MRKPLDHDIVKKEIKKQGYELIGEYKNNGSPVKIIDKNNLYYFPIYSNVIRGLKPEVIGKSNPYSFINMETIINKNGKLVFKILNKKYISSFQKIHLVDNEGYKYETNCHSILAGNLPFRFSPTNKYTLKNIKLHLKINKVGLSLLSNKYLSNKSKLEFKCIKCKSKIKKSLSSIINNFERCQICKNLSKGERKIKQYLDNHQVKYIYQNTFDDCKFLRKLKFDFFIPSLNLCVEYNGKQHYTPLDFFGGKNGFKYIRKCYEIKRKYCLDNKIRFLEIGYFDFNKIDKILNENL